LDVLARTIQQLQKPVGQFVLPNTLIAYKQQMLT
jgi:hypothetical protein